MKRVPVGTVAKHIAAYLDANELTQAQLAERTTLSRSAVSRIVSRSVDTLRYGTVVELAAAIGASPEELLADRPPKIGEPSLEALGEAELLAFTITDHYEPHIVADRWFDHASEASLREDQSGPFRPLAFAIVRHGGLGRSFAMALHADDSLRPTTNLNRVRVQLYRDGDRIMFCACERSEEV